MGAVGDEAGDRVENSGFSPTMSLLISRDLLSQSALFVRAEQECGGIVSHFGYPGEVVGIGPVASGGFGSRRESLGEAEALPILIESLLGEAFRCGEELGGRCEELCVVTSVGTGIGQMQGAGAGADLEGGVVGIGLKKRLPDGE